VGSAGAPWPLTYPLGLLEDLLPHPLYLCRDFTGEPSDVHILATDKGLAPPSPFDDLRIMWRGERAIGQVVLTLASSPERNTVTLRGTKATVVVDTNLVTELVIRDPRLPALLRKGAINLDLALQLGKTTVRNTWDHLRGRIRSYPEIGRSLAAIYSSLSSGAPLPADGTDGLAVVEIMESARRHVESLPGVRT
jgi:predicted dehydrogenase